MLDRRGSAAWAALMALGVTALATFAFAAPAAADVTVTPSTGTQGSALKLVFKVTEERAPAYTTQVDLYLPADTPVAEVYPMSVPHWAPRATMRTLDKPIEAIHGIQTRDVVSMISWTRAANAPAKPSAVSELIISIGPLPRTAKMVFTVVQKYSDGVVVRWADPPSNASPAVGNPAPALSLRPRSQASGHRHASGDADADGGFGFMSALVLSAIVTTAAMASWFGLRRLTRHARARRAGKTAGADPDGRGKTASAVSAGTDAPAVARAGSTDSVKPADLGSP